MAGVFWLAAADPSPDEVVGLTAERFGVLVIGLALVVMCAAAVMVASWLR